MRLQCLCLHRRGQGQVLRGRPRGMGSVIEWCDQLGAALGQCQEPVWTLMLDLILIQQGPWMKQRVTTQNTPHANIVIP